MFDVLHEIHRKVEDTGECYHNGEADLTDEHALLESLLLSGELIHQVSPSGEALNLAHQFAIFTNLEPDLDYDHYLNEADADFENGSTQRQHNAENTCLTYDTNSNYYSHDDTYDRKNVEERKHVDSPLALLD